MRVAGIRMDGAVWLNLDGGMAVILREDRCSPAVDPLACEKLGPWDDAHGISGSDRREIQQRLDRARTMPLATFLLEHRSVSVHTTHGKKKFKFEYSVNGPDEKKIGDKPTDEPALDTTQVAAAKEGSPEEEAAETPAEEAAEPSDEADTAGAGAAKKKIQLDKDELGHGSDPKGAGGGAAAPAEKGGGGFFSRLKAKIAKAVEVTETPQDRANAAARQAAVDSKGAGPTLDERLKAGGTFGRRGKLKLDDRP